MQNIFLKKTWFPQFLIWELLLTFMIFVLGGGASQSHANEFYYAGVTGKCRLKVDRQVLYTEAKRVLGWFERRWGLQMVAESSGRFGAKDDEVYFSVFHPREPLEATMRRGIPRESSTLSERLLGSKPTEVSISDHGEFFEQIPGVLNLNEGSGVVKVRLFKSSSSQRDVIRLQSRFVLTDNLDVLNRIIKIAELESSDGTPNFRQHQPIVTYTSMSRESVIDLDYFPGLFSQDPHRPIVWNNHRDFNGHMVKWSSQSVQIHYEDDHVVYPGLSYHIDFTCWIADH